MAKITSGATSDQLTIDATSKAARVTKYDTRGNVVAQKPTYSAAITGTAAPTGTTPFFSIGGSGTKTIRIQKIIIQGSVATTAVYGSILAKVTSTATSGGTPTTMTKVPHDANSSAATATLCQFYTAAPTAGSKVGDVASTMLFMPVTGTAAAMSAPIIWDWTNHDEQEGIVLRGSTQCLEIYFGATTTNAPTLTVAITWTEE